MTNARKRDCVEVLSCVLALVLMPGCSAAKSKRAAEAGVDRFHAQLNAAQYHDIYSHASADFQKSGTEAEITEFLSAVHRKLGEAKDAKEQTFVVNFGTAGTTVTLTYQTQFESGPASEQFVWRVGSEPLLVNYRIDSRALITK